MSVRAGLTRAELLATVLVVVLAVVGVLALWPSGPVAIDQPAGGGSPIAMPSDADLAGARAAAALPACPGSGSDGVAASGPLAHIRVPCLGRPGDVKPAEGLAGRDALLNVWASWCAPCRAELPALAAYAARPDAVPVLGIDLRDRPSAALELLTSLGVRLPVVVDTDEAIARTLKVTALPSSYLLRADGSVARVQPAIPFRSADEVADAVSRLRRPDR